ncbi:hypothetical protein [Pyrobaculum aerophilum]|uniref:Uncharacterized protein n=1 Tax=Pyrobaculum aerophilum TaxID=13773 RepID=A0A371QWG2_9CREN|nr:hypothetical protein [Pyrobaculum aerophilum]RFA94621.1 hypothetical protein CGL51_09540 [Pyrobaculum aerophilum]RFB00285.1 hypothetical protein CGL52_01580 [Pyrobaculum aerophilum]
MADEFAYPEYVVEILAEIRELRKEVAKLQREVADLSKKVSQAPQQPANADVVINAVREAVERLNSAALAVVENASAIRSLIIEERGKREEICMALLERLLALQEALGRGK